MAQEGCREEPLHEGAGEGESEGTDVREAYGRTGAQTGEVVGSAPEMRHGTVGDGTKNRCAARRYIYSAAAVAGILLLLLLAAV